MRCFDTKAWVCGQHVTAGPLKVEPDLYLSVRSDCNETMRENFKEKSKMYKKKDI